MNAQILTMILLLAAFAYVPSATAETVCAPLDVPVACATAGGGSWGTADSRTGLWTSVWFYGTGDHWGLLPGFGEVTINGPAPIGLCHFGAPGSCGSYSEWVAPGSGIPVGTCMAVSATTHSGIVVTAPGTAC